MQSVVNKIAEVQSVLTGMSPERLRENAHAIAGTLVQYDDDQVIRALERCATECEHRLKPSDVIKRLPPRDLNTNTETVTGDRLHALRIVYSLLRGDFEAAKKYRRKHAQHMSDDEILGHVQRMTICTDQARGRLDSYRRGEL